VRGDAEKIFRILDPSDSGDVDFQARPRRFDPEG
jgi:hypothetical protein